MFCVAEFETARWPGADGDAERKRGELRARASCARGEAVNDEAARFIPKLPVEERLLATAARLFARDGLAATGVNRLAVESGVSKQSLYDHFGSKEALIEACLDRESRDWCRRFEAAVEPRAALARDAIEAIFDFLAAWFADPGFRGSLIANAVAEAGAASEAVRRAAGRHEAQVHAFLEAVFERSPDVRPHAPSLARRLRLLISGATTTALLTPERPAAEDARTLARLMLTSLGGPST